MQFVTSNAIELKPDSPLDQVLGPESNWRKRMDDSE